jgi:hypothetical protein
MSTLIWYRAGNDINLEIISSLKWCWYWYDVDLVSMSSSKLYLSDDNGLDNVWCMMMWSWYDVWRCSQAGSVDNYCRDDLALKMASCSGRKCWWLLMYDGAQWRFWCMTEHSGGCGSTEYNFDVWRSTVEVVATQKISARQCWPSLMYDGMWNSLIDQNSNSFLDNCQTWYQCEPLTLIGTQTSQKYLLTCYTKIALVLHTRTRAWYWYRTQDDNKLDIDIGLKMITGLILISKLKW